MEKLTILLEESLNNDLLQIILSNARNKEKITKVKIRPVVVRNQTLFQSTSYIGKKVIHENYSKEQMSEYILSNMKEEFLQLEMTTTSMNVNALVSKKGKMTLKIKKKDNQRENLDLSHNRKKRYILEEGKPVPFLVDLQVMTAEGRIIHSKYDKFRQINRYLEFIEDILPALPKNRECVIVDFGCGKSYLTFAMYYYLKELKGYDIRVIGLDLKEDVIQSCNDLREQYGYHKLNFLHGDIATFEGVNQVDMVVTLHACDTATDYALAKAVRWNASVILSVPCCQHELNAQIQNDILKPVLKYGLIKERMASLFTDALRAELLEEQGYDTQILEFIDMEHTPKNILIRAVKKNAKKEKDGIRELMDFLNVKPTLFGLFEEDNPTP